MQDSEAADSSRKQQEEEPLLCRVERLQTLVGSSRRGISKNYSAAQILHLITSFITFSDWQALK